MAEPIDHQSVQIFSDDKTFLREAAAALSVNPAYKVSEFAAGDFPAGVAAGQPANLVVLDVDDGGLLSHPALAKARGDLDTGTALLVVSQELSSEQLRGIVRLSSRDWLRKPVDRRQLLQAVINGLQAVEKTPSHVSAFVSASGGVGASTVAINAAYLLGKERQRRSVSTRRCMLLDLDFASGACGYYLDIENRYDLRAAMANPSGIDIEFVDIIKKEHPEGFHLLSIKAPEMNMHSSGEEVVLRLIDVISFQYPYVVIDMPYYEMPWTLSVLESVDTVTILAEGTIPSLKHARDLYLQVSRLRDKGKINVICNRYSNSLWSKSLSKKQISKIFANSAVEFLPEDGRLMSEAANRGIVPLALNPKAPLCKVLGPMLESMLLHRQGAAGGARQGLVDRRG